MSNKTGKNIIKQEHSAFIVAHFSIFIVYCIEWDQLTPPILFNLWNGIIQVSQHWYCDLLISQRISSHLLKKPLSENFILCAVTAFKKLEVIRSALGWTDVTSEKQRSCQFYNLHRFCLCYSMSVKSKC